MMRMPAVRPEMLPSTAGLVSQWDRLGVSLLTGSSGIFYLSHLWQFHLARQGFRVHTVDCAIRFDAYAIAEEALRHEISPEDIHDRITVSRCFTPYQILDEIKSLLDNPRPDRVCFVLAPAKQFFDGDVAKDEGEFLLQKLSLFIEGFQKQSIPLMVVEKEGYGTPVFEPFIRHVRELARPLFHLHAAKKKMERQIRSVYSVRVSSLTGETA